MRARNGTVPERMIHLDTNYLIGLAVRGSTTAQDVDTWLAQGEQLATSAIAWTEFLNGPVMSIEISRAEAVLESRILSFGRTDAFLAAQLFNSTGRRRGSRFDCLIAATAIGEKASLATANRSDFQVFVPHGLALAGTPPPPAPAAPLSEVEGAD